MTDPAVPSEVGAPYDWCPECDGPGECQPGTCCGRPYPALAEAERWLRSRVLQSNLGPSTRGAVISVLAEYDRRGEAERKHETGVLWLVTDNDRLRAELARCREVVQAATAYIDECESPAPDLTYRAQLRRALAAEVAALSDTERGQTDG